ncbi:hypothetical protein ATC03_08975 [Agromyces aureus]|uniref:Uncharacterized protein n=2 Tax=Agromyces aureus TaxID=453304 RepID=A0A191WF67_9MICO|nr:hypothetical protein ATC03_08975 [Agromyces aureus]
MDAVESPPGVWTMVDSEGDAYGTVRIVRIGAEVGYVGELRGQPVGRWRTLRASLEGVHHAFIASHGPRPFQGYPDFRA